MQCDARPNWSPDVDTCLNVPESKASAGVLDFEATSLEEPTQENLRKKKQEPLTEERKQSQEAETNSIETMGVEIIEEVYDTTSNSSTKKPKLRLKRVFKRQKKRQRDEKIQCKEITPSSDARPNRSPDTCLDVPESKSSAGVLDFEARSLEEPTQENLRKMKQEPLTEKQSQGAETNSIETMGVEIIEEVYDTTSNSSTKKPKLRLKRVFKRQKKGQGDEKIQGKAITPFSYASPNWSPDTCLDVPESKSSAGVQDFEATSLGEPTQENLRKVKQEPLTEEEKQSQEAETNSIETMGVEIIEEVYDTNSNSSTKKPKLRLKRVFKGKKKGQRDEKIRCKEISPSSDARLNWSPDTCLDVPEAKSSAGVQDFEATSLEEPRQENLRKMKQKPLTEEEKQSQEAETNSIETMGVEIIEEIYDTSSTSSTNPPARVGATQVPVDVEDSPMATLDVKKERNKKKRKWFVVRFRKKTKEANDSDARKQTSEKAQIETMSEKEKRRELLERGKTTVSQGRDAEKKKRGLKTPWKNAKRKRKEKDSSSESENTEESLSHDIQDNQPSRKNGKRKWPRLLKKKPEKRDSVPEVEVVVKTEQPGNVLDQPKQTLEDLQREVKETQDIVRNIVENKLAERDEKLRDLTRVAEDLEKAAEQFEKVSRKVRVKLWLRNRKWTLGTVGTVLILLSVCAIVMCVIFV
ncbi:restin homolog [Branchiostoma floridae]|uniref:Restin homolog n=1 Tax=Branchiostoma floridae TaxID=7739 RepID=A0A9J7HIT0_BRAFL|nr:restin homolog [Branchiostoma floridae]